MPETATMRCDACAKEIRFSKGKTGKAATCPACGEMLRLRDQSPAPEPPPQPTPPSPAEHEAVPPHPHVHYVVQQRSGIEPGSAALLSLVIPGLGQALQNRPGPAIALFIGAIIGWALCFGGPIVHIGAAADAYNQD